jgi:hypothetical protein
MYTRATSLPNLYIRNIIPDDMGIPPSGAPGQSGWGYTDFHAGANFAFWGFSEVRRIGSSLCFVVFLCAQSMRCAKMSRWTDALLAAILYYRRFT